MISEATELARPARHPFQFALKTLLLAMTLASVLLAVLGRMSAPWSLMVAWFILLLGAHISANAWGTRVAPFVSRRSPGDAAKAEQAHAAALAILAEQRVVPPATQLGRDARLSARTRAWIGLGAAAGGLLATILLALGVIGNTGFAGVVVGGLSGAILGGFTSFLGSSFVEVAGGALDEARRGPLSKRAAEADGAPLE